MEAEALGRSGSAVAGGGVCSKPGLVVYGAHRGAIPVSIYYAYCWPAMRVLDNRIGEVVGYWDWIIWWESIAVPDPASL